MDSMPSTSDTPPPPTCWDCAADLASDHHHAMCVAPLDQLEGDA